LTDLLHAYSASAGAMMSRESYVTHLVAGCINTKFWKRNKATNTINTVVQEAKQNEAIPTFRTATQQFVKFQT